jgi:hypothetical protein
MGRPTWGCVDVPRICIVDMGWGVQLVDVPCIALRRPTCGRALRCVGVANLRTCIVLRSGAHLADAPCISLGHPTLVRPY